MLKIALLTILTGCGSEPESQKSTTPAPSAQVSAPGNVAAEKSHGLPALLVEALPACTPDQEGWIVYLKPAAELEACEGGAWAVIDVKGHDGKDGKAGVNGSDGKPGVAGADGPAGIAGAAGAPGADGRPATLNTWADPVSGQTWLLGGTSTTTPTMACSGDWRLPTNAELVMASSRGIYGALPSTLAADPAYECGFATDSVFSGNVKPGDHNCFDSGYQPHPRPWGIYCLKDGGA